MDESECTENELYSAGKLPATRDWLHHANQSLSRLKEVKKTSYRLGGGPREREVNCHCNYRSKSKSSYLSLGPEPPQLALDSQETASLPDLSIPEIVKQFNERQSQKKKPKRRPHSSSIYTSSTKSAAMVDERNGKKTSYNCNTFITVKGQTVTPQARPPHGWLPIADSREDYASYKGVVYLDQQPVEHQASTLEGLRRYSAAYGDDEDDPSDIPPVPRVSPEPGSPRTNSPECIDPIEESFSEDDDDAEAINNFSETKSVSSAGCRSLVFAIPTGGSEGGSDEEEVIPDDFNQGRLSADYVAKSETLLGELDEKNQAEAAEISDMFRDMENAKEKINNLHISPRDLELQSATSRSSQGNNSPHQVSRTTTPSIHLVNMQMEYSPVDRVSDVPSDGLYETFWVEEPVDRYTTNVLPSRNSRVCSAGYMNQHAKNTARVKKHQSENSLVLQGKTMEFFNSEDLAAKTNLRDLRRTSEPHNGLTRLGFTGEKTGLSKKNVENEKVSTKPPLPKCSSTKNNARKQTSKQKHRSDRKMSETDERPFKPSLRKSISDGNIHLSVTNSESSTKSNALKKSVTFRQDVVSNGSKDLDCRKLDNSIDISEQAENDIAKDEATEECSPNSRLSAVHHGVVIQNGLEMEEAVLNAKESSRDPDLSDQLSGVAGHLHRKTQSTRAKILSKMTEIPHEGEPCACRSVTRPTTALLEESKSGRLATKEAPSRNEKLLKSRPIRPSSAPIKRQSGVSESKVERPKSPRRKPRAMSATVQRKRTASEGAHSRPRPSSAHVGRASANAKDVRRSRAAAQVLKEGYLFKERPPPSLPPAPKERQPKREVKRVEKEENNNERNCRNKEKDEVVASEECQEVFARLQEKGIEVSMETIKRGLMAPARKANDYSMASFGKTSGLLSRPENWLPEEHARVQVWDNVLKGSK